MLKEFREFALKGSVVDLAVGIIIGGAFGKIVSSLVNDIVMPVLGLIVGKIDLTGLKYDIGLKSDGKTLSIMYGSFLQNVIDFLIIAFSIFLMVKLINSFRKKKKEEEKKEEAAKPTAEEVLLTEIRDLLKDGKDK